MSKSDVLHRVSPREVEVKSWNPFLLNDLPASGEEPSFPVEGELYLPSSDTRSPAVFFSQGLGGVRDARERTYAA
jgi:hypothetical protein